MRKRDITLIIIMLFGAVVVAILPQSVKVEHELCPHDLMIEDNYASKYISTDELAKALMNQDPSIVPVDLRDSAQFASFSLQSAINMPLEKVLDPENFEILKDDAYTYVLYGNGSVNASRVWLILRRMNVKNVKVLEGGLNTWFATIIQPKAFNFMAVPEMEAQYRFRTAASKYFGRASAPGQATAASAPAPAAPVAKREKKAAGGGGCG